LSEQFESKVKTKKNIRGVTGPFSQVISNFLQYE